MMTIKIIQGDGTVHLFEAINPTYKYYSLRDFNEWTKVYKDETWDYIIDSTRLMPDMPESVPDNLSYVVLAIRYFLSTDSIDDAKNHRLLFVKNATVFIMQEGKTVDKMTC